MGNKEILIQQLHELYLNDSFINDLFNSAGISLDNISDLISELDQQNYFDKLTFELADYEKLLKITPLSTQTTADRQATVQAKWLSGGTCTLLLIQAVCNAWLNGEVAVLSEGKYLNIGQVDAMTIGTLKNTSMSAFAGVNNYLGFRIIIQFIGKYGIPNDLNTLLTAIGKVIPCHIPFIVKFKYLLISDVQAMTIGTLKNTKMGVFA